MKRRLLMLAVLIGDLMSVIRPAFSKENAINIVFIPKADSDSAFWKHMHEGAEQCARESGNVALTWRGPRYIDDSDAQIEILKIYATTAINAIVIAPIHRARLDAPIREAAAMGIKIVVVDSTLDDSHFQNFIGTNNYAAGKMAAERLSILLRGEGTVLVFRMLQGSSSTDDRADGFVDHLKKYAPNIKIILEVYPGGSKGMAFRRAIDLLKKPPQIDGIFAVNETSSEGMLRALRAEGLTGKKKFIAFDSPESLLDGLEKREINGLVVQNPRKIGYLGVKAAIDAVRNHSANPEKILIDATMVTLENYKNPEIQKLLSP